MGRTAKTYRLPAETLDQIEQIAEREECSATRAVVLAVRAYSHKGNAGAGAEHDTGKTELVQALRLQVETLTRALDQSQQLQLLALGKRLPAGEKGKKKAKKKKRV